ncbi:MAG TPA: DsbA family protein [Candidatus Wildermuthbacteria bacterium]|nr:DsbA family protein [Candidatus Wildermuthbacteria bacterium]
MSNQTTYIVSAIVLGAIIIAGAIMYGSNPDMGRGTAGTVPLDGAEAVSATEITITPQDYIRGNVDASITIVEYSDLECPFCARFHPTMLQALLDYPEEVRWVYRHFPLRNIHAQAQPAAEASECVAEQEGDEGFWMFVDAMFEDQSRLGASYYREVAGDIGVDLAKFDNCVSSGKYANKVNDDYNSGIQLGVTGTPGSFLNGIVVKGAVPYEQLQAMIESQL